MLTYTTAGVSIEEVLRAACHQLLNLYTLFLFRYPILLLLLMLWLMLYYVYILVAVTNQWLLMNILKLLLQLTYLNTCSKHCFDRMIYLLPCLDSTQLLNLFFIYIFITLGTYRVIMISICFNALYWSIKLPWARKSDTKHFKIERHILEFMLFIETILVLVYTLKIALN